VAKEKAMGLLVPILKAVVAAEASLSDSIAMVTVLST
jgi:hypothetical protein